MTHAFRVSIAARRTQLKTLEQMRVSLGYENVLARGFALVRDAQDRPVRLAAEICDGALLDIQFADGRRSAVAGPPVVEAKRAATRKPAKKREQGSLF